MILLRHRKFHKQYKKLNSKQQALVDKAITAFVQNPTDPKLRNHKLKGKYSSLRSIDAAFDLRIVFYEEGDYVVVTFLQIGTHSQLY